MRRSYTNGYNARMAKVSLISLIILIAIIFFTIQFGGNITEVSETIPVTVETTAPVNLLSLTPEKAMPIPPKQGRGEPIEDLVPMYGEDYIQDPEFRDIVIASRRWEWNVAYSGLNTIVQENSDNLDAYRLQAELYIINQNYDAALAQIDRILERAPEDVHALGLSIFLMRILGNESGEAERVAALYSENADAADAVCGLLTRAEELFDSEYTPAPRTGMVPDAITVFGQTPKADGTPSAGLLSRLEKALELAEQFPNARIILSGGDLKTEFTEAEVMFAWLAEHGVEEDRMILDEKARDTFGNAIGTLKILREIDAHSVIVVGTMLHLPRATTTMTIYAESQNYDLAIDAAGGGTVAVKDEDERLYTYVQAARAGGLFTKSDYSRFN